MTTPERDQPPAQRRRGVKRSGAGRRAAAFDAEPAARRAPRTGAKRTIVEIVGQLPTYLRLLFGLITDRRVNAVDKALVLGALAYIAIPMDVIPDFIPFLGQVDDVFLLLTSVERLITNAGRGVVLAHWRGDPADLSRANLRRAIMAASFFLPRRMRRRLRVIGRRS